MCCTLNAVQNLISIIHNIVNDKLNIVSVNLLIKNNWNKIVNTDVLSLANFEKAIFFEINKVETLNIFVNVISSAIIFVKTKIDTIKKSIQLLTGIDKINIVLHQVLMFSPTKQKDKQCL